MLYNLIKYIRRTTFFFEIRSASPLFIKLNIDSTSHLYKKKKKFFSSQIFYLRAEIVSFGIPRQVKKDGQPSYKPTRIFLTLKRFTQNNSCIITLYKNLKTFKWLEFSQIINSHTISSKLLYFISFRFC